MNGGMKTLAMLLVAAAALYGLRNTTPGYGEITSPIAIHGLTGERVQGKAFAFAVANIHLARTVRTESLGRLRTYTTSGVWLVIEGAGEAARESLSLTSAEWLGPSGVRYAISQRFSTVRGFLLAERFEPGLPRPALVAFEVPESEAFGGTLLIARSALTPLDEELWIEAGGLQPHDIRSAITIARDEGEVPWTLRIE